MATYTINKINDTKKLAPVFSYLLQTLILLGFCTKFLKLRLSEYFVNTYYAANTHFRSIHFGTKMNKSCS